MTETQIRDMVNGCMKEVTANTHDMVFERCKEMKEPLDYDDFVTLLMDTMYTTIAETVVKVLCEYDKQR